MSRNYLFRRIYRTEEEANEQKSRVFFALYFIGRILQNESWRYPLKLETIRHERDNNLFTGTMSRRIDRRVKKHMIPLKKTSYQLRTISTRLSTGNIITPDSCPSWNH